MTCDRFLEVLNSIDFSRLYWEFCDRFPYKPGLSVSADEEEIEAVFKELRCDYVFDSRDRSFTVEEELIGDTTWHAVMTGRIEMLIAGRSPASQLGSNFADLAYEAKRKADPTFKRDPFKGPPPYPRPCWDADPVSLREIVSQFLKLVRLIKNELRKRNQGHSLT